MAEKNVWHEYNHLRYTLSEELIPKSIVGAIICPPIDKMASIALVRWVNLMLSISLAVRFIIVIPI